MAIVPCSLKSALKPHKYTAQSNPALTFFVHFDYCAQNQGCKNRLFCKFGNSKRGRQTVNFCKNIAKCRFGDRRKMMYICIKVKEGSSAPLFL